ncbi:MAG: GNAT family N-acetyltransferase [Bacillota bacterium]
MEYRIEILEEYDQELLDRLVKLEKDAFGIGGLNKWHLTPMIHHGKVFVIYVNQQPVGLAEVWRSLDQPQLAYLFGFSISSEYQKQGLGSKLLEHIITWLQKRDFKLLELTVDPANKVAIYFYQDKFDFKEIEFREAEYGRDEPRLVMRKDLE